MLNDLQIQWLKALRSGEYKQAKHRLRDDDCFCCLGVLCDIVDPDKWGTKETNTLYFCDEFNENQTFYTWDEDAIFNLPIHLALRVDLFNMFEVQKMNDSGKSFNEIADYLEEMWLSR